MMNIRNKLLAVIACCAAVIVFAMLLNACDAPSMSVTDEHIEINQTEHNPANCRQYEANINMMAHDGKLYFYTVSSGSVFSPNKYAGYLSVFEDGTAKQIKSFSGAHILLMADGFVYYEMQDKIFCYNVNENREYELFVETFPISRRMIFYSEDGSVYLPKTDDCAEYIPVHGDALELSTAKHEEYSLKAGVCRIEGGYESQRSIVMQGGDGSAVSYDLPYGKKSLIPCGDGLLVHNEECGDLLYYIDGNTGKAVELFSVECIFSVSAVNCYEGQVFLSFKRYEKSGEKGMLRFENDTTEGTYRIDLSDYSTEKISDQIYNGLFIFDDTGIYACNDDSEIFKLDFDGNVILELIGF